MNISEEAFTTQDAADHAVKWCATNPGWKRICDIEHTDVLYKQFSELSARSRAYWERRGGEDAWLEWGNRPCKMPFGFVTGAGEFVFRAIDVPRFHNAMMVVKLTDPSTTSRKFHWTEDSANVLVQLYPDTLNSEIAIRLGITAVSVQRKAQQLGLKKAKHFQAAQTRRRHEEGCYDQSQRLREGRPAWNAGLKGWDAGGRAAETRFKTGERSPHAAAVGSYRLDKFGTLQRKISEVSGNTSMRWRSVHELVWIQANGPVPDGHVVVFKPGMKSNRLEDITLDKIDCISRADNLRRNSYRNYPEEIVQLIQIRGVLNRRINDEQRKNDK